MAKKKRVCSICRTRHGPPTVNSAIRLKEIYGERSFRHSEKIVLAVLKMVEKVSAEGNDPTPILKHLRFVA